MKQILDDEERKLWFSKVKYFFEKPFRIKENFLLSNNWAAVPYERGSFSIELSASISKKLDLYSIEELIAIQVEEWNDKELQIFKISNSQEDLMKAFVELVSFYYIIIPAKLDAVLFNSPSDYQVLAGSKNFVEDMLNKDIEIARKEFWEFANDKFWQEIDKNNFISVAKYYEKFNG